MTCEIDLDTARDQLILGEYPEVVDEAVEHAVNLLAADPELDCVTVALTINRQRAS